MRWLEEIDALEFGLNDHELTCVIHRLAFRVLLNVSSPKASQCLIFANNQRRAFEAAAQTKAKRTGLEPGARFHITSRDVRNSLCLCATETTEEIAGQ